MTLAYIILLLITLHFTHSLPFSTNNWQPNPTASQQQLLFSNVCQSGIREDNTNYIYCARKHLTQVPIFSKNNVVYDELVLADNRITELQSDSFSRIKVKKIFLNGNPLRYIDDLAFKKLQNHLEELWIDGDTTISSNNLLAQPVYTTNGGIPKSIVEYLGNLNTLHIKGFLVSTLTNGILRKLRRIEVLSLKFCSIEQIEPLAFEGLDKSLRELYLDGNLMQEIPSQALLSTNLKSLQVLSLAQNRIKVINQDSFGSFMNGQGLSTLAKLDLSYNGLKSINSNAFIYLNKSLETLKMQNNEVNSFNLEFIRNLAALREFNLAFNVITHLPGSTFAMSSLLEVLELQGNSLTFSDQVPQAFHGLNNLQRLNLARNGIRNLPSNIFRSVYRLQSLSLDKNPIENFNTDTFSGVYQTLKNLSLQNTDMKSVDLLSLQNFMSLERLKISFNQIDEIDWSVFDRSHMTLVNLDARKNQIKSVRHSACDQLAPASLNCQNKMERLVELDLSGNQLCGFNTNLLSRMPRLKNLGLSQNPLYCDCKLLPLYEWSVQHFDKEIISFIQWQCEVETPGASTYRQFTSLTAGEFKCVSGVESKCQQNNGYLLPTTTTTTTTTATTTVATSKARSSEADFLKSPSQQHPAKIGSVELETSLNAITVHWSLVADGQATIKTSQISGFKISFTQPDTPKLPSLKSFTVEANQRHFKIQNLDYNTKYSVCVSIIQFHGYDKYCRDITTKPNEIRASSSTTQPNADLLINNNNNSNNATSSEMILPGLLITVAIILVLFILGLFAFVYFYVTKCRASKRQQQKQRKSLMLSSSSSNSTTMNARRPPTNIGYQSAKLTTLDTCKKGGSSSSSSSPQSTSTISNPTCCSCVSAGNPGGLQQQQQICHTMGRHFMQNGTDTSTVSSTLSNENISGRPNQQQQLLSQENEALRSVPSHQNDLISSSPTSFQHFTLQNNQHVNYMPYEVFNNQNFLQQLAANTNNSTLHYDKLSKLNQIILNNNNNNNNVNSDHVYCEIPSQMGQTMGRALRNANQLTFNNNNNTNTINPNVYNFNQNPNLNSLHQHLVTQSLLMASNSTSNRHQHQQQTLNTFQNSANNRFTGSII
jgi:Leucine-rich repeat (LRR) protein